MGPVWKHTYHMLNTHTHLGDRVKKWFNITEDSEAHVGVKGGVEQDRETRFDVKRDCAD